jgi:hypothetical protein
VYDAEANAYVSHPRNTQKSIITVNSDGTASQTSFNDYGTSLSTKMHILGKINVSTITMIDEGPLNFDLLTLYPKESIAVFAGTSYFGWNTAIPTGYIYISRIVSFLT